MMPRNLEEDVMNDENERKYRDASAEYRSALGDLSKITKTLNRMKNDTMYDFKNLGAFYRNSSSYSGPKDTVTGTSLNPFIEWPSQNEMDSTFRRAFEAFDRLKPLWESLTAEQREILQRPPEKIQPSS
jgi:hypothetical protein